MLEKLTEMLTRKAKINNLLFLDEIENLVEKQGLDLSAEIAKNISNIESVTQEMLENLKEEISSSDMDKQIKILE